MKLRQSIFAALLLVLPSARGQASEPQRDRGIAGKLKTHNVLLVTTDGLRWQELFGGADPGLMNTKDGKAAHIKRITDQFAGATPELRRKALFPFIWTVLAKGGQLFGNATAGSEAKVTNGRNFSYPGYNEILTGWADSRIDSNLKVPNRNVSVLEWLNNRDDFRGRVAAFGSWDRFPFILNVNRSKLPVEGGWGPLRNQGLSGEELLLSRLIAETPRVWDECMYDSFTFHAALHYFKRQHPRLLYVGLGETDEFAHEGRYHHYLVAAHQFDHYLRILWETVQALDEYRGTTTMIISTDHGRGDPPVEWRSHGAKTKGSERIWIGVLGPDTPALGERTHCSTVTQSQIAASLAALLGLDYRASEPRAAAAIDDVLPR